MNTEKVVSKVLVLDNCDDHIERLKSFCSENSLVGLRVREDRLMSVLQSNIDLGAILLSEGYAGSMARSAEIALDINGVRPELPIILRREHMPSLEDLPPEQHQPFCAAYVATDLEPLHNIIDEYIFSLDYPNALVRGILEITETMLSSLLPGCTVEWNTPSIVRDRIIFGEVFSLIPLESNWCRGYMMMQAKEKPILDLLNAHQMCDGKANFRDLNSLLGEATNLIWGAFKNRYLGDAASLCRSQVQVPLIVNHQQKYISFGTENPQLVFMYRLIDKNTGEGISLHQRFVFNLAWSPEDFTEIPANIGEMVDSGELELF
ncbi:chemotaxis protein CheX [Noviherbaspirillum pedocola]|uniref:Chemotaxis protein CheX n=1 Tax=Noviherbaspirillum pedocola TaxID=2801341 RepID=A0A934SXQ1_9BURK|nr:chemotaxis protein CheX [Noviherbaspirillum pedocola]MBK4737255.1 chemotaxis protein CheX [Noviherbaspirillum pedocola]